MKNDTVSHLVIRTASRVLLVLALLVLQQGMLTHALSHVREPAKPHGAPQCELCHAFAAADAEIPPAPPTTLEIASAVDDLRQPSGLVLRSQRFVAFASRAPPRAL